MSEGVILPGLAVFSVPGSYQAKKKKYLRWNKPVLLLGWELVNWIGEGCLSRIK